MSFLGVGSPQDRIFDVVLTIWVTDGPDPSWRRLLLPGHAYPTSELSWRLCVSRGGATVSGSDGMDSSTQVPAIRTVWVPAATYYGVRH
jgi:hypothetical protein